MSNEISNQCNDEKERMRAEKEEMLNKKIEEMKKKNEARAKKFLEAEEDRKRAEEAGCAVVLKSPSNNYIQNNKSFTIQNNIFNNKLNDIKINNNCKNDIYNDVNNYKINSVDEVINDNKNKIAIINTNNCDTSNNYNTGSFAKQTPYSGDAREKLKALRLSKHQQQHSSSSSSFQRHPYGNAHSNSNNFQGHQKSFSNNKYGNGRGRKYVPGTSEEWHEYIKSKAQDNINKEKIASNKENKNANVERLKFQKTLDNNLDINKNNDEVYIHPNNNNEEVKNGTVNDSKKETIKVYSAKRIHNENAEFQPPPDPTNRFLADSYRDKDEGQPNQIHAKDNFHEKQRTGQNIRRTIEINNKNINGSSRVMVDNSKTAQQQPYNLQPNYGTPQHYQQHNLHNNNVVARPRIVGSGRLIDKDLTTNNNYHNQKHVYNNKNSKPPPTNNQHHLKNNVNDAQKPLKSILKKPINNTLQCNDVSTDIILAVITTPGDDVGIDTFDHTKQEAICDWLKQSEHSINEKNCSELPGNDDDEWEDVDDEDNEDECIYDDEKLKEISNLSELVNEAEAKQTDDLDVMDENEESQESFQKFIEENTLYVDLKSPAIGDWANEMDKLSQEKNRADSFEPTNNDKVSYDHSISLSESIISEHENSTDVSGNNG